jgi:hypothetical protein
MAEEDPEKPMLVQFAEALHDMCQPLTALQCRLELGRMDEVAAGDDASEIWADCLRECVRLNELVDAMRTAVQREQERGSGA